MIILYKAVVIDDEPWVVKTLVDSVNWSGHHFEVAGTSSDSREGLELIRTERPDLVFIDIRMPDMNGLEFMKQAKALKLPTRFIVVSGFAEFSYAQKALLLGAIGYCLKPIDEVEIEALLKKVKEELDARMSPETPLLIERIVEDFTGTGERVKEYLAAKGLVFDPNRPLLVVCCLGADEPPDLSRFRYAGLYQGYRKSILLIQEDPHVTLFSHFSVMRKNKFQGIGLSRPVFRYEQLKFAVEEAELAAHHYFLTGGSSVCQAPEQKETSYSEFRELYPALQKRDRTEIDRLLNQYLYGFVHGRYHLKHALLLYHTIMTTVIHSGPAEHSPEPYLIHDYELLIERYETVEEMVKDLKRMCIAYAGDLFAGASSTIRSDSFKGILKYIHEHHQEEITLQKLSDTFFINPNYISQMFIKHLAKPFTAYVAEFRVRNACHRLTAGNESIQEIAAAVGIPDPYYFSKIFRKITGTSPREYRRNSRP